MKTDKAEQLPSPSIEENFNTSDWVRGDDDFKPNMTCKEIRQLLVRAASSKQSPSPLNNL